LPFRNRTADQSLTERRSTHLGTLRYISKSKLLFNREFADSNAIMSSISSLLFDDIWKDQVHVNTRNLVLARLSPVLVCAIVLVYLISLPIASAIGSRVRRNWSPVLIPYFGLFFGCYAVGELIALLMTNWGQSVFVCHTTVSDFNQLVITYLQFMFCAFQFIHAFDTIFLLLAGHSKLITRAHVLERILLIFRSYLGASHFPVHQKRGITSVQTDRNSFVFTIVCRFEILSDRRRMCFRHLQFARLHHQLFVSDPLFCQFRIAT
jgi:hypothetical protein